MAKIINLALILFGICLIALNNAGFAAETKTLYAISKYSKAKNPLYKIAKQKTTVGIVPYYVIKGKKYIFLGQELPGGKRDAAGTFSDFGGSITPDNKSILEHALREFKEETMGQMRLNADEVIKNGYVLYKKSAQNRDIYYIFVKFNSKQYAKTLKFHTAKVRLKASGVPNSYLEKETYLWVSLDDLLAQLKTECRNVEPGSQIENADKSVSAPKPEKLIAENQRVLAKTPSGETVNILIRGYFVRDCLQNPELPNLLQQL